MDVSEGMGLQLVVARSVDGAGKDNARIGGGADALQVAGGIRGVADQREFQAGWKT
jgi:hypothetical protein